MVTFDEIRDDAAIFLYCGDMPVQRRAYTRLGFIGLSMSQAGPLHIRHDITAPFGLRDDSVDIVQSEDVMEHIPMDHLPRVIDEIHRILKPGGLFRMSVPDYNCDVLARRVVRCERSGETVFDPGGGGYYDHESRIVRGGGHVWFPTIALVRSLLDRTRFAAAGEVEYMHFYEMDGTPVLRDIDYARGYVARTPDHDTRVAAPRRPLSIVVDCTKMSRATRL